MKSFYYLRHGQTEWNITNRLQGLADIPLNDVGRQQAHAAREQLGHVPFDVILSSPLVRAKETADIVAHGRGVKVIIDNRLREKSHGVIDGMTLEEIESHPTEKLFITPLVYDWAGLRVPLNAEHLDEVAERAAAAMFDYLPAYDNAKILVVSHGAWFRALAYKLTGQVMHAANAEPYFFEFNNSSWQIAVLENS